jgi:dUTP pyrophosphatase
MALGRPRSSLCRCGVSLVTAVWDAGYRGRSTALLHVVNPAGFTVERDARLLQLVFFTLNAATEFGYAGVYHGEHTSS